MALWGSSRTSELQSQIEDIQNGLAALGGLLGGGANAAGRTAARGARSAADTVTDTAGDMSAAIGPVLGNLTSQIDSLLSAAGAVTGSLAKRAGSEGKTALKAVESKVEDNAMFAVLAAAGVGFLLGTMIIGGSALARNAAKSDAPSQPRSKPPAQRRTTAKSGGRAKPRRRKTAAA